MKTEIHPAYHPVVFQDAASDFAFLTRSTMSSDETIKWEDGNEYPVIKVDISSASHPFYTGKQKVMDTGGRIDKFKRRYASGKNGLPLTATHHRSLFVPNKNATLTVADQSVSLPLVEGNLGPSCIDIGNLYRDTEHFTFDPGFAATASCKSAITYIDGEKGVLLYRGYPIEQLAEKSSFLEVAYLLLEGELPSAAELSGFEHD
ncbi:hypothetical protein COL154_014263, partial [Colletotrichum chrysophilum]